MRHSHFTLLTVASVAFALALPVAVSPGSIVSAEAAPASLPVVTTFTPGDFPESLALDAGGNLYASLGFLGEVVPVSPSIPPGTSTSLTPRSRLHRHRPESFGSTLAAR